MGAMAPLVLFLTLPNNPPAGLQSREEQGASREAAGRKQPPKRMLRDCQEIAKRLLRDRKQHESR